MALLENTADRCTWMCATISGLWGFAKQGTAGVIIPHNGSYISSYQLKYLSKGGDFKQFTTIKTTKNRTVKRRLKIVE